LKYLGTDIDKHYWISSLLVSAGYLKGDQPLPHLALLIKQQALTLLRDKTDKDSLGDTLTLSVTAAILSESLGLSALADGYKRDAERILARSSAYEAWLPALDQYDRCLYNTIGKRRDEDRKTLRARRKTPAAATCLIYSRWQEVFSRNALQQAGSCFPG
jgi:hypothetical protein